MMTEKDNSSYLRIFLEARELLRMEPISEVPPLDILCMSCKRNDTSTKTRYYCEECSMHICRGCVLQHDWLFGMKHELVDFRDKYEQDGDNVMNGKDGYGKVVRFNDTEDHINDVDYEQLNEANERYRVKYERAITNASSVQNTKGSGRQNGQYSTYRTGRKVHGDQKGGSREFVMKGSEFRKRREQGIVVERGQTKASKEPVNRERVKTEQMPTTKGSCKTKTEPVSKRRVNAYGKSQHKTKEDNNAMMNSKYGKSKVGQENNEDETIEEKWKDKIDNKDSDNVENENSELKDGIQTNQSVIKDNPATQKSSDSNVRTNSSGRTSKKTHANNRLTQDKNGKHTVGEKRNEANVGRDASRSQIKSVDVVNSGSKSNGHENEQEGTRSKREVSQTGDKTRGSSFDKEESFLDGDEQELRFGRISRSPYERNDNSRRPSDQNVYKEDDTKEMCDIHKEKTLIMHCKDHNQKGCMACVLLDHRFCDRITYINEEKDDNEPEQQFATPDESEPRYIYATANRTKFYVRDMTDSAKCDIFGCCLMPNGNIILIDRKNKKLKQLSKDYKLRAFLDIKEKPHDICRTVGTELAISVNPTEDRHEILFANSFNESLSFARKFQVDHPCYGLAFRDEELYVCSDHSVFIYKTSGQLVRKIYEDKSELRCWMGIALGNDLIYISKHTKDGVIVVTDLRGNELSSITDQDMNWPFGICIAGNGNVFVSGSSAIVQVDAKCTRKLATVAWSVHGVRCCQGLAFNKARSELIVGQYDDSILVLRQELTKV